MTQESTKADAGTAIDVRRRDDTVCLVGMGYVGLPLAVGFDEAGFDVLGFDVDPDRIRRLREDADPTRSVGDEAVAASDVAFTADPASIADADIVVVAVPTPVTADRDPDTSYVEGAGETIGEHVSRGTTVVLESTVYPGLTAEVLVPALERTSGYEVGEDIFVGYSPERANVGDTNHGLNDVVKVVSAFEDDVLEEIAALYETIVDAGVYRAPSVETAEAAKVIENVQRDVNIALVNELAMAFDHLDLDTQAVLDAAGTKWNFHEYEPGLVGGHCIPVDPHYFVERVEREGFTPELVRTSRSVNERVPQHVADLVDEAFAETGRDLAGRDILVLGLTYKPDVADVRATAIAPTLEALAAKGATVVGHDPHADDRILEETFGIDVVARPTFTEYDGVVVLTPHSVFETLDPGDLAYRLRGDPVVVDVKGLFDGEDVASLPIAYRTL